MSNLISSEMKRAVGFGAGAAALRTSSILLSREVQAAVKVHPALGAVTVFLCQALTVSAITSGALATYYTTQAVTKRP